MHLVQTMSNQRWKVVRDLTWEIAYFVLATSLVGPARQACIRLYSVLFLLRLAPNASYKPFQLTKVALRSFHNLMANNV